MTDESILRKIQKAMALATDQRGDSNTAAIALRQAQRLMEIHGVTEGRLAAASCGHADIRSKVSVVNPTQWEVNLVVWVAEAFGCRMVWGGGGPEPTNKGYFTLVGPKSYLEVAVYTVEVSMRQLLKERAAFVNMLRMHPVLGDLPRAQKSAKADAFCMGWTWAVKAEIHKMADPDGLIAKGAEEYISSKWNTIKQGKSNRKDDGEKLTRDHFLGGKAGESFKIHRPMNSSQEETLKLE